MRYAITGATGFLGGVLALQAAAAGHDVVAAVRSPRKSARLLNAGIQVVPADLADTEALTSAFDGVDGVFHVAGWYQVGSRDPAEGERVNVEGTRHVLAAAAAAGVRRIVHTSTCAVNSDTHGEVVDETFEFHGEHISEYDRTKAVAHRFMLDYASEHDLPEIVVVMPGGIYGPGDTSQIGALMRDVAAGKRVVAPSRLRLMQAHVDDVAYGHLLAMTQGGAGESYMLTGERTNLHAMLSEVAELTGGVTPIDLPGPLLPVAQLLTGIVGRVYALPSEYTAESLRVSQASYYGTSAKAERELGWTYRGLTEGLAQTVSTYLKSR